MFRRVLSACVLLGVLAFGVGASAQGYGEGFGLGGVLLPDDGYVTILGTSRLGESLGLELGVGLDLFDNANSSSTEVGLTLGLKKFWNTEGAFQPFFGGHVDLIYTECDCGQDESEDTRIGMSAVVGGEYFVTRRVSLEGEVGAGIYFGSFGLETSTRLAAFMYL